MATDAAINDLSLRAIRLGVEECRLSLKAEWALDLYFGKHVSKGRFLLRIGSGRGDLFRGLNCALFF